MGSTISIFGDYNDDDSNNNNNNVNISLKRSNKQLLRDDARKDRLKRDGVLIPPAFGIIKNINYNNVLIDTCGEGGGRGQQGCPPGGCSCGGVGYDDDWSLHILNDYMEPGLSITTNASETTFVHANMIMRGQQQQQQHNHHDHIKNNNKNKKNDTRTTSVAAASNKKSKVDSIRSSVVNNHHSKKDITTSKPTTTMPSTTSSAVSSSSSSSVVDAMLLTTVGRLMNDRITYQICANASIGNSTATSKNPFGIIRGTYDVLSPRRRPSSLSSSTSSSSSSSGDGGSYCTLLAQADTDGNGILGTFVGTPITKPSSSAGELWSYDNDNDNVHNNNELYYDTRNNNNIPVHMAQLHVGGWIPLNWKRRSSSSITSSSRRKDGDFTRNNHPALLPVPSAIHAYAAIQSHDNQNDNEENDYDSDYKGQRTKTSLLAYKTGGKCRSNMTAAVEASIPLLSTNTSSSLSPSQEDNDNVGTYAQQQQQQLHSLALFDNNFNDQQQNNNNIMTTRTYLSINLAGDRSTKDNSHSSSKNSERCYHRQPPPPPPLYLTLQQKQKMLLDDDNVSGFRPTTQRSLSLSQILTWDRYQFNPLEDRAPYVRNTLAWTIVMETRPHQPQHQPQQPDDTDNFTTTTTTTTKENVAADDTVSVHVGAAWQINRVLAIKGIWKPNDEHITGAIIFKRWRKPSITCSIIGRYNYGHQQQSLSNSSSSFFLSSFLSSIHLVGIAMDLDTTTNSSSIDGTRLSSSSSNENDNTNNETKVILPSRTLLLKQKQLLQQHQLRRQ